MIRFVRDYPLTTLYLIVCLVVLLLVDVFTR